MAECSESTGTIWPGLARPATSWPPMISDSLLASARVLPASMAARVAASPTAPVTALSTTLQGQAGQLGHRVRPGQHLRQLQRPARGGGTGPQRTVQLGRGRRTGDRDGRRPELQRLAGQQVGIPAAGGQAGDAETAGIAPDDIGGLGADGPGRTEQDDLAK